jgi:LDH2 family malate/lactate/ureidoglycolate dehydrogenase
MIGMVWGGGYGEVAPATVPYGGKTRVLHTNPISIGLPAGEESTMMFDWATTALSGVKVDNAYHREEQLPPNSIVNKDGVPTTNPADFFDGGGHLPFGGHKGYTLMMTAEFLGRIFTGADSYVEAGRGAGSIMRHQGVTMIAIKADLFQSFADFAARADEMERRVRAVPPAPGFDEVLAPGDMEASYREQRRRDGIPIADDIWQSFTEAAASVGVNIE